MRIDNVNLIVWLVLTAIVLGSAFLGSSPAHPHHEITQGK